jgi:hypothetical protein
VTSSQRDLERVAAFCSMHVYDCAPGRDLKSDPLLETNVEAFEHFMDVNLRCRVCDARLTAHIDREDADTPVCLIPKVGSLFGGDDRRSEWRRVLAPGERSKRDRGTRPAGARRPYAQRDPTVE